MKNHSLAVLSLLLCAPGCGLGGPAPVGEAADPLVFCCTAELLSPWEGLPEGALIEECFDAATADAAAGEMMAWCFGVGAFCNPSSVKDPAKGWNSCGWDVGGEGPPYIVPGSGYWVDMPVDLPVVEDIVDGPEIGWGGDLRRWECWESIWVTDLYEKKVHIQVFNISSDDPISSPFTHYADRHMQRWGTLACGLPVACADRGPVVLP